MVARSSRSSLLDTCTCKSQSMHVAVIRAATCWGSFGEQLLNKHLGMQMESVLPLALDLGCSTQSAASNKILRSCAGAHRAERREMMSGVSADRARHV